MTDPSGYRAEPAGASGRVGRISGDPRIEATSIDRSVDLASRNERAPDAAAAAAKLHMNLYELFALK